MSIDAKTLGEEIIGAEIVAGKELTEVAGSALEAMEQGTSIWLQQGRWWLEDYGQFLRHSVEKPGDPSGVINLLTVRSEHVSSGFHQMSELVERECAPATRIWSDFLRTVLRDWRTP